MQNLFAYYLTSSINEYPITSLVIADLLLFITEHIIVAQNFKQ